MPGWVIVCIAISATALVGLVSVYRYDVFSPIDESSHYDYVRFIAEKHRLPVLGNPASEEMLAVREGVYPKPPKVPAKDAGLAGTVYEAIQPPLYYLSATPLFWLTDNYRTKVTLLRLYGLGLYLLSLLGLAAICKDVARDKWKLAFAFGTLCFLMPGNVIRAITVSNEQLDFPLGVLATWLLWRAYDRKDRRYLFLGALAVGLGLLTKLSMVAFLPALGLVALLIWRSETYKRASLRLLIPILMVPALMLVPWVSWNLDTYGTPTGDEQLKTIQQPIINPTNANYGIERPIDQASVALDATTPSDWFAVGGRPLPTSVRWILLGAAFLVPALFVAARPRTLIELPGAAVLVVPLVAAFGVVSYSTVVDNWDLMVFRYLRPTFPGWFVAAFLIWDRSVRSSNVIPRLVMVSTVSLGAVWWAYARNYLHV